MGMYRLDCMWIPGQRHMPIEECWRRLVGWSSPQKRYKLVVLYLSMDKVAEHCSQVWNSGRPMTQTAFNDDPISRLVWCCACNDDAWSNPTPWHKNDSRRHSRYLVGFRLDYLCKASRAPVCWLSCPVLVELFGYPKSHRLIWDIVILEITAWIKRFDKKGTLQRRNCSSHRYELEQRLYILIYSLS